MHHNLRLILLSIFFTLAMFLLFFFKPISNYVYFSLYNRNTLSINLSAVNAQIHTISAESSNRVFLNASVKNSKGLPMSNIPVKLFLENGNGKLSTKKGSTNAFGEFIFSFSPQNFYELDSKADSPSIEITAQIITTNKSSSIKFNLISTPIVLIYGYQEAPEVYDNLSEYLTENKFNCSTLKYDSKSGVISCAKILEEFLYQKKQEFSKKGILISKFTLITHSMGGLVARHYTTSEDYININDVSKIIFTSAPHKGSYIASLGENFYNDQSIKDLSPDSDLFTIIFEAAINKGLNQSIQVANIASQYDEVVTEESSSLDEWKINTEMFNIGESNFTMDSILSGNLLNAPNHKGILNNKKVFQRILEMLNSNLSYPSEIQK